MDDRKVIAFKEREGNGIGGKGIIFKQDCLFTLPTFPEVKICYEVKMDVNMYNQCFTYDGQNCTTNERVFNTLLANRQDTHYIPSVVYRRNEGIEREYVVYSVSGYSKYKETLPTLRASGGDAGGGSEGIVIYEDISENHRGIVCK